MTLALVFDAPGMTQSQYDQIISGLEAAGEAAPPGRLHHLAARTPGGWYVVDIWESQEAIERFAQTLMPLIQRAGVSVQPQMYEVYRVAQP